MEDRRADLARGALEVFLGVIAKTGANFLGLIAGHGGLADDLGLVCGEGARLHPLGTQIVGGRIDRPIAGRAGQQGKNFTRAKVKARKAGSSRR